jgi:orotidine-5'-phosphate decarboxylase
VALRVLCVLEREDQRRVVSLEEAIRNGADMVVLGRSILRSQDPVKTVEDILPLLQTHP